MNTLKKLHIPSLSLMIWIDYKKNYINQFVGKLKKQPSEKTVQAN